MCMVFFGVGFTIGGNRSTFIFDEINESLL